ncbi:hypothetical protein [Mesoterricola sediminis]|uniref:Uncharacterized protein n=1 Tax=Mesoterricola sediminis TaxID=2927980 RepID=A0AA48GQK8_9BACT|nr:hypothetical protein [Mesoterricola sediminis]BDU75762.1 hypothetical protein METESE_07200 [Mesoterricola sediminis]
MILPALLLVWPPRVDGGVLLLVAALFLASVLAHRYWRAVIRLEDAAAAREADLTRRLDRYQVAFRRSEAPAAFVDRITGLVVEATPGWAAQGLPAAGTRVFGEDPGQEDAWRRIPPPAEDGAPAEARTLDLAGRRFSATCLGGPSLGLVHLTPA